MTALDSAAVGEDEREAGEDRGSEARARGLRWWREVVYTVLIYLVYSAVRNQFGSGSGGLASAEPAFNHAKAIIQLQSNIGLYFEDDLQRWYLDLPGNGLIRFWNVYYGLGHFVVTAVALIWMFRRFPSRYRLWRNTLAVTTLLALVGFASFSLMPPRLLDDPGIYGGCQVYADGERLPDRAGEPPCDEYGYVDTVAVYGGWASFGSDEMAKVSNQFAAMPSMHIGWSMWVAFVMVPMVRRRWAKALVIAYPLATLFDIMVTANHYWIDGLGGAACLGVGFLLARLGTRWWEARSSTASRVDAGVNT
ncbi:MAG TPA: phosphatase PAP2 family protein [Pseudonocardiaceae bacterium]|nr:phosphatase PAP2 family protein [Pseudonocardiaceae bacterium]